MNWNWAKSIIAAFRNGEIKRERFTYEWGKWQEYEKKAVRNDRCTG
jgi:hypothetical protein